MASYVSLLENQLALVNGRAQISSDRRATAVVEFNRFSAIVAPAQHEDFVCLVDLAVVVYG